ncbi:trehalose-6-phosphatase synthase S8 [Arabidopsis thaliana]|uniref:Trehalose-6-phosphatase synthase S8 n=1 Tax=Arabidopsis thaliana TaxID=3702 RepID=A0A1P8AQ69_ARATH|nr:trehalose-6-phosphatase synthase S8 [Arabidopsis thaliana]ANM58788.1 trehalose-6-phosphatase synthase S8 [Arabidopsis thaliana]|eukprot:NP_001321199.1 trehalose-6-phosphatase synthase S8 [Arabidopsis thaliana]
MVSRSCANFLDLSSWDLLDFPQTPRTLPRVMTVPGIITDVDGDTTSEVTSTSGGSRERKIIVANMLPLQSKRDAETGKWCFNWDEDSLQLQLRDGFSSETEFLYVGSLNVDIETNEQEEVSQKLLEEFNCVATFLSQELQEMFYLGFCKHQLWPLFHYMLPMFPDHGDRFDRRLWQAYVSANKIFSDRVMEVINPEDDYVWIQDYHLMVLPTFLRKRFNRIKLGFFLHSPFPSSEIYRTLPVRDEILRGLDYFGRTVYIKILPVGVHMGRLESVLSLDSTAAKTKEIQEQFKGKKLVLGIDDMDIFKGISLKLIAMEHLFETYWHLKGKVVLVQIVNPARSSGKDVEEAKRETYETARRINERYGTSDYKPIVLIDRLVPRSEKTAYYAAADCCLVNAVRDGMNLVPYKYIVCRQGTRSNKAVVDSSPRTSTLVVSEFIGCSPSLSGAIRVNPWDVDAVAEAVNSALKMSETEKQLRHEKHYHYISTHDVGYWAKSFMQDLERACRDHYSKRCWGIGFGLGFRVLSLSPSFRKLSVEHIVPVYRKTQRRAIFLDYDGTLVPESSIVQDPSNEVVSVLKALCEDPNNTVFIVSGRGRESLSNWLSPCENLGIAAEHGYFIRWKSKDEWETCYSPTDTEWRSMVEPVMRSYMEATDGTSIEFKESALVWHHQDADPDFGSCQAKEMLDHLESVLANEPVVVKRGQHIVEVKPQGVSKGLAAEKVIREMVERGEPPEMVMCIGDDRSDEDMFESILSTVTNPELLVQPEVFACTVGRKPSKAKYFLDDEADVLKLLRGLGDSSSSLKPSSSHTQVAFESIV